SRGQPDADTFLQLLESQLVDSPDLPGALRYHNDPVAGDVPQPADRRWSDEAGPHPSGWTIFHVPQVMQSRYIR
ncbi:MAG: hypothetical protein ACRDTZ_22205, partial [Pseudonocardiaceae bacterium]